MQYVKWLAEKYAVNIQRFDAQHQKLIEIINQVFEAKMNHSNKGTIAKILEQLNDYTKNHFRDEEVLLSEHGYPALEMHKTAHAFFINKIRNYPFTR